MFENDTSNTLRESGSGVDSDFGSGAAHELWYQLSDERDGIAATAYGPPINTMVLLAERTAT